MQKFVTFLSLVIALIISGCGSFDPGSVEKSSALTNPKAKENQKIFVLINEYDHQEGELIFDDDYRTYSFQPIYISVFNNSDDSIIISPKNVDNSLEINHVYEETKKKPFKYFLLWSTPYAINLALGHNPLIGFGWAILGAIATGKTANANGRREAFLINNQLPEIVLKQGKEIDGIVFVEKSNIEHFRLTIPIINGDSLLFTFNKNNLMEFSN